MLADTRATGISDRSIRRVDTNGYGSRANSPGGLSDRDLQVSSSIGAEIVRRAFDPEDDTPAIHRALRDFVAMPNGWDSYGGRPLDPQIAITAERFLLALLRGGVPSPHVVPTSLGGLALEWHDRDREFAIEIRPDTESGSAETIVFFSDGVGGEEWEAPIGTLPDDQLSGAFRRVVVGQ